MARILDFYFQLGVDDWASINRPELAHTAEPQDFAHISHELASDGHRYQGAVIFPFPSAKGRDYSQANEEIYAIASGQGHPISNDRVFFPAYAVIPRDTRSLAWLKRILEAGHPILGIKLWPYMGRFSLTDFLRDRELVELVLRHRLLVMMHVGTGRESKTRDAFPNVAADPATAIQVASALPEVDFLFAHLLRLSESALEKVAGLGNVYLDTSGLTSLDRWQEGGSKGLPADDAGDLANQRPQTVMLRLSEELGLAEQLIFGSNWPFCKWWGSSVREEASIILESPLSFKAQEGILVENAVRLLGRHGNGIRELLAAYNGLSHIANAKD